MSYLAAEEILLRYGLVGIEEVPKKPKRLKDTAAGESWTYIERKKGGVLEVLRHLREDDPLPDGHPLSEFGVQRWPLVDLSTEMRRLALVQLHKGIQGALGKFH